jgi:N-carbamoylputrescine amidase
MREVKVAATQMACTWNREETLKKADRLVREAAKQGAKIILLQELFETPYFCQKHDFQPDSYDIPVKEVVTCQ